MWSTVRIIVPEQQSKTQTIKADDYGWLWFHLQTRSSSLFFFPMSNIKTYLTVTLIYILNEVSKFFKCLKIAYRSEMRKILSQAFTDDLLSLYLVY